MAKNRERRTGFVARWVRRIWWLRRVLVVGAIAGAAAKAVQGRGSGGSGAGGSGGFGGRPGGSGKPATIGGPFSPSRSAAATPPSGEPESAGASAAPAGGVRTLVSVPPLTDVEDASDGEESDDSDDTPVTGASLTAVTDTVGDVSPAADPDQTWVAPFEDGSCPPTHPIKANDNSGIYHVPGGRFYKRTVAEHCYPTAEAAETDGYRPAKA